MQTNFALDAVLQTACEIQIAQNGGGAMAIFHFTIKIVGRSKGRSIIATSAYLNGDVMKNEETGRVSYYTSKKEVVYTQLMMCENAPPEWEQVPEENIKRFMNSVRYKRADDKDVALEKFRLTFCKQRLWNEVLKVEKDSDAQLGRSIEFSLPKEWSRTEQIQYTTEFIQTNFVDKGMCADWSIHDKGDGNPHVHLLLTMRPFQEDGSWGNKEVKDWAFVRDADGNIVIDTEHPNWWQDKKNPERCGIRLLVLDENGNQKVGARNRKQWKRVVVDATGWNDPKNCELWRSEWAKLCNRHLPKEKWIDHRSFARQGRLEIPTIHEGANARKIENKFYEGKVSVPSWKVEKNQLIKRQNAIFKKLQKVYLEVTKLLEEWKERVDDIRRKPRSDSATGRHDRTHRGTAIAHGGTVSGIGGEGQAVAGVAGAESTMARIGGEVKRRESFIESTERAIAEIKRRLEKVREVDERINQIKARRANTGIDGLSGNLAERERGQGQSYSGAGLCSGGAGQGYRRTDRPYSETEDATARMSRIKREIESREQERECADITKGLEANKRFVRERAR